MSQAELLGTNVVEKISDGHEDLEKQLEGLLTSRKLVTWQIKTFFTSCEKGQTLWDKFQEWLLTNPDSSFEDYVLFRLG